MALTRAQEKEKQKHIRYWTKREAEQRKHNITEEKEYSKELQRIYDNMLDACQKEIDAFYGRYAKRENITLAEAKKAVSELDIKAYERKAKRYVKEKNFSKEANEEMRLYNLTMKINRLEMLKANIGLEMIAGHDELQKFMEGILKGRTMDELERQAGILGKTIKNNAQTANAIVNASFHNAKFSDRIWMHQDLLKNDLHKLLQSGLIAGKNPRVLAKEIKQRFDVKTSDAERLMRTELARVQTEAQKQSFERNGFTQYTFLALGDACPICADINGNHYKVEDMQPGLNAPPMHPHCRCSTAAYEDDDEYNAWLEYLENGGTTEEWEAIKKANGDKFKPAETIEEAIERANAMGVKYAEFKGMPIERVNNILEAVETLPKDCRPVFIGNGKDVSTIADRKLGRKADQWYGVTYDYRLFSLRTMHLGYDKTDYDGGLLVGLNTSKFKTLESLTKAKLTAQKQYAERTGRKWFFNTDGKATAFHEMGHCFVNVRGLPKGFEEDSKRWAKESKCDMLTNPEEAFSEAWAAYCVGNKELPDYIEKYIKEAMKG